MRCGAGGAHGAAFSRGATRLGLGRAVVACSGGPGVVSWGDCTTWGSDTPVTRLLSASCSAKPPFGGRADGSGGGGLSCVSRCGAAWLVPWGDCTTWGFDAPVMWRWVASCSAKPPFGGQGRWVWWGQSIGCEVALHTRRRLWQAWGVGAGPMVLVGLAIAACLDVPQPGSRGGIAALGARHAGDTP